MEDIKYSKENIKFALRVGAIIYDKNKEKVLSFRGNDMNFYMLPGGKIKEFETSEEAVIREVKEELGYTDIKFDYTGVSEDIVDKLKVHQVTINYKGIFEKEKDRRCRKRRQHELRSVPCRALSEVGQGIFQGHPGGTRGRRAR